MQDVTPWPESFEVSQPVARVLVDGREVDVESVTVSSELASAMPERVVAGGGIAAATGDAQVVRAQDVSESGFNPWGDAAQFADATEVVVEAGYRDPDTQEVGCVRQITGQVDALSGGALSNAVGLDFMDRVPSLDQDITIEPLLLLYPPLEDGGARIGAGLSPFYVTNRVLRHCGFYSTPPLLSQSVVSAPLFGSGVPERGRLLAAERLDGPVGGALFLATPWGLGLSNGVLTYAPTFGARGHGRLTSTLHVSFHRDELQTTSPGTSRIDVQWGSWQDAIHVQANDNGTISVRYRSGGSGTTVVVLAAAYAATAEAFTVLVRPSGETTIYASNGASATGVMSLPAQVTSSDMSEVIAHVPDGAHRLGGVQVAFTTTRNEDFVRTAHIESPTYWATEAFPSKIGVNCLALLKEQAEAELAAMWVDEYGHFQWRSRQQLRDARPLGTLTATDHLVDLPWQFPIRSVFSRVELDHASPLITRRTSPTATVSSSRGSTLGNGDTEDVFYEPPADEDWHMVEPPQWVGGTVDYSRVRRALGSYYGGVIVDDDGNEQLAYSSRLSQSWSQINPQRWVMSSSVSGLGVDEFIEQRFRDRKDLYGRFSEEPLPLIRARGVVQWEDHTYRSSHRGPQWAPVFRHKVGPWVQNHNALESLADYLGEHLTKPEPVLSDIQIIPDPRIQLGDVFWLVDQTAYHVRLRVVIMGKTLSYQNTRSGPEMSQTITCRVIEAQKLKSTYDDLAVAWVGQDYDAFQAAWSGADYEALQADPLERN